MDPRPGSSWVCPFPPIVTHLEPFQGPPGTLISVTLQLVDAQDAPLKTMHINKLLIGFGMHMCQNTIVLPMDPCFVLLSTLVPPLAETQWPSSQVAIFLSDTSSEWYLGDFQYTDPHQDPWIVNIDEALNVLDYHHQPFLVSDVKVQKYPKIATDPWIPASLSAISNSQDPGHISQMHLSHSPPPFLPSPLPSLEDSEGKLAEWDVLGWVKDSSSSSTPPLLDMPSSETPVHHLTSMSHHWNDIEKKTCRRVVEFEIIRKINKGQTTLLTLGFKPIYPEQGTCLEDTIYTYPSHHNKSTVSHLSPSRLISCIYHKQKKETFITSVDLIALVELVFGESFLPEDKNRLRRNLEKFRPFTVGKSVADGHHDFFQLIMGYHDPKPRNTEKDLKVFPWRVVEEAVGSIAQKFGTRVEFFSMGH